MVLGGIPMEFVEHACNMGATPPWEEISWDTVRIDPEMFKIVCDKLCTQAGVNVLFHTLATDVLAENGHITGVVVETKTGRKLVTGQGIHRCHCRRGHCLPCRYPLAVRPRGRWENPTNGHPVPHRRGTPVSPEEKQQGEALISQAIADGAIR